MNNCFNFFLGIVDNDLALDNKTINILNYANGPGFYDHLSGGNKEDS